MLKFHRNKVYRHNNNASFDIYIVNCPFHNEHKSVLKIRWVSRASGNFVIIPGERFDGIVKIEIKATDYDSWSLLK